MKAPTIRKVLLAVPPTGLYIREDRCQTPIEHMTTVTLRPPIDLMYAAAVFDEAGVECHIVDYPGEGFDEARFEADLREFEPDLVLLSVTTPGLEEDMLFAALTKSVLPNAITAAKGAHFNTLDRDALERYPALDLALRGEYEVVCRELAEGRPLDEVEGVTYRNEKGQIVRSPDRPFLDDLDSLPFPARSLINKSLYIRPDTGELQTTLVTNRGCPFDCIFCLANQVAGRKNRVRSVGNIIAEIEKCVETHGIRNFLFRSDLFTANRAWLMELCGEIQTRGLDIAWSCNSRVDTLDEEMLVEMKKAGCWIMAFGIESGNQEMLKRMGKRTRLEQAEKALAMTRRVGVLSSIYFLVGLPWETRETLRDNDRFARKLDPDVLEIFYVYPFPGTPLYAECVRLNLLKPGEIPRSAYDGPAMASLNFTREELAAARNRSLRKYYMRPRVILRTFSKARSPREFLNYMGYGLRMLKEFFTTRGPK